MILDQRALNRATLARQLLLERADLPAAEALTHLVGMQAQAPNAPYVGLWSRLRGFRHEELGELVAGKQAVRGSLLRATVHLVTAADFLLLRAVLGPAIKRFIGSTEFTRNLAGADLGPVFVAARELMDTKPLTKSELGAELGERFPGLDPVSLGYVAVFLVPTVHVPPRGVWGRRGPAALAAAETFLGRKVRTEPRPAELDEVLLRYLGGYGPATVLDAQAWSGLTRLREVAERLRPKLVTFRDEQGRELLDLPEAPRPDPDTAAPVRFLPEYDNLLLSHADRTRVIPDGRRVPLPPGAGGTTGTVLVDGYFRATWTIAKGTLTIKPFVRFSRAERTQLEAEGVQLLGFAAADAGKHDVVFHSG